MASSHRCIGCELIADKQEQLGDVHGAKVALLPYEIHAALQVQEAMNAKNRRPRPWDDGAEDEDE